MQDFKLDFLFDHAHHQASVSVLQGTDHVQYTIVPDDPALEERFATQVVHRFGDNLDFAFPGEEEEEQRFNEALEKALRAHIKQHV